ncbi:MAG: helix-turn-helix domain-containing protein [Chlamydiia bacterium]
MQEELIKLGRLLKAMREEKRLSIKEVESSTSIRSSYLEALEEGKEEVGLSDVYHFGFMRQYASFLDMDMIDLEKKYPQLFQNTPKKQEFAYGIGTLEKRTHAASSSRGMPNVVWIATAVLMMFVAWQLAKYLQVI